VPNLCQGWKRLSLLLICTLAATCDIYAIGQRRYVDFAPNAGSFPLVADGRASSILVDKNDYPGVRRAVSDLQTDITRVTKQHPSLLTSSASPMPSVIVIGTLGKNQTIDEMVRAGKLEVMAIRNRWESFLIQTIERPWPGVERALVITGSDKRGTIFGVYDLSEEIGVSPWYWWADVPVKTHDQIFIRSGRYVQGEPAVKYRGIFLNDEAPALTGWVKEKFGDYNHQFYEKVFELLLRLKANYLWPAMWNSAFNEDDPLNPKLADEYGIVMGTSHHEPMLRAQQEWKRHGQGAWDYTANAEVLRDFWSEGVRRNKDYESIVTLAMRGDGDLPMSRETNTALLERIVADQRKIIARVINPDVTKVPQVWALYKEVQEYYEKGMRVPDDVTLLWCDDNWGNIRRLPTAEERTRAGGAGIYYHFDYVGGPRSYKWLNTIPITKVREQMDLAYQYGARRIWIVNVGDLKPMEFPIEFFLTFARNPDQWPADKLDEYTRAWATREFGPEHAVEIAEIVAKYTKFNGRRKPELLEPATYSLVNYREAETVVSDYQRLSQQAETLYNAMPAEQKDAFFQLVLYPVKACAVLNNLYVTVGRNRLYAVQGRASTNDLANQARVLFRADQELADYYNRRLAGGKWDHMMDQTHIGYTFWNQPVRNAMPAVQEIQIGPNADMGVAIEGSPLSWPEAPGQPALPPLSLYDQQSRYFEIFNRGTTSFQFRIESSAPWLQVRPANGRVVRDERISVNVNWTAVPPNTTEASIIVNGPDAQRITITVPVLNLSSPKRDSVSGFVETDGCVSIEAEHYTGKKEGNDVRWLKLPDFGRTLSAMTIVPVTAAAETIAASRPHLDYQVYLFHSEDVSVDAYLAPTQKFQPGEGLRYGISFDDESPQVMNLHADYSQAEWERSVKDGVRIMTSKHKIAAAGAHVLKFWALDPGVVLEKVVIKTGVARPSYLGPPESLRN
jgi:glycosyl hydrolase family 115 (putative glucuronidase)/glycosyl hydrolase family 115